VTDTRGTWLDHADDCPQGSECNCDHPALMIAKSMEWGNE
jgi:hypothetical protein